MHSGHLLKQSTNLIITLPIQPIAIAEHKVACQWAIIDLRVKSKFRVDSMFDADHQLSKPCRHDSQCCILAETGEYLVPVHVINQAVLKEK